MNYYPGICLERFPQPRETSVTIAGISAEVLTEYSPNTSLQHRSYTNLLGRGLHSREILRLNLGPQTEYFGVPAILLSATPKCWIIVPITDYSLFFQHSFQFVVHNCLTLKRRNMCRQKTSLKKQPIILVRANTKTQFCLKTLYLNQ